MSVRLSKAIRELNIGLQTAVEFLEKKGNLGEVKNDLSFKLSEQQYEALVEEFKSDKDMRTRADKIFAKKTKEKKKRNRLKTIRLKQYWRETDHSLRRSAR